MVETADKTSIKNSKVTPVATKSAKSSFFVVYFALFKYISIYNSMNRKTFFRLAQPAATTLLALSIFSIPAQMKAYSDQVEIRGTVRIEEALGGYFDVLCHNCYKK